MSTQVASIKQDDGEEEIFFSIPADDGKAIYCVLNRAVHRKADRVVVIGHGLTGHVNEALHQSARRFFNARGFDVVRMSFYCAEKNARNLQQCTLAIHAKDMNAVIRHVLPQYKKVFVAGHSYGGLTILFANPQVDAVSFWDASFVPTFWKTESSFVPELDCYKIGWGTDVLIGKAMFNEAENIREADSVRMAAALKAPAQVILAEDSLENEKRHLLFESLAGKKEEHEIPGADHCFNNGETVTDLLERTTSWFERF